MNKYNVALIYGGDSSEVGISVLSGRNVAANIDKDKFEIFQIMLRGAQWDLCSSDDSDTPVAIAPVDKSDFSVVLDSVKIKFDIAFIMIHGTPGENGLLQGYFEMMGIPFTTCSSYVSALTFDKYACKTFLRDTGVRMAKDIYLRRGDSYSVEEIVAKLGLPLFVKPSDGGSSFGVTKVREESELEGAIADAFSQGETVLIEEFISGREVTQGVYAIGERITALPVTEIISHNDYFDYQAKYLGQSDEVCPADISAEVAETIRKETYKIYHHFGCKGIVRMDYILHDDVPYFLEVNTVPGMTKMSLVPQQLVVAGISMSDLLTELLEDALGVK